MIKQKIKKFEFVEKKWQWASYNPCVEITLPMSQETVIFRMPSWDMVGGGFEQGELNIMFQPTTTPRRITLDGIWYEIE
jgi:hypothetical protein